MRVIYAWLSATLVIVGPWVDGPPQAATSAPNVTHAQPHDKIGKVTLINSDEIDIDALKGVGQLEHVAFSVDKGVKLPTIKVGDRVKVVYVVLGAKMLAKSITLVVLPTSKVRAPEPLGIATATPTRPASEPGDLATASLAWPADGITMDMMPVTGQQIATCRDQASQQLAAEQNTLHKREHGQDNDKMEQGAIAGVTGAATSAISRRGGWWYGGNNNGAQTAAATGATQRTDRNSDNVASTTGIAQDVGKDAYSQCVSGIKGPEYVHFRQTGKIEPFTGAAMAPPTPAVAAAPAPAPRAAAGPKSPVVDEGDGKHFVLTAPGQTHAREVTRIGTTNSYLEEGTGDKYIVMPDGSVTRIPKRRGARQ